MGSGLVTRARSRAFSDGSLTKKASLNSVATAINQGARAIVGFVVNPLLVRYLGPVTFGNWQVVHRLIGQTNPAGGRPSEALKWFIAHRQSSDDLHVKRQAVGSALVVWLIFIPILLPIGVVVGWFAPIWLEMPPADYSVVRLTAAILVASVVIMGLTNIPWAALVGENLGYKRMGITAGIEFVGGGLMVLAAVTGTGLIGLAGAIVAMTILSGLLYLWLAHAYIPWFGVAKPDVPAVRKFLGLSWWFLVWNFVTRMTMGGDIIVLGIAGSATQVTTYSLTRFIPLTITAAVASLIFGMAPGLGGLIGAGEMVRAARVRSETMAVAWLMATVAGAGVLLWEESFLRLWVDQVDPPGVLPTLLIVLMVVQLTFIRVDSNIIDLTLNIRRKVLLGLLVSCPVDRVGVALGEALRPRHHGCRRRLHRRSRRPERHLSADDRSDPHDPDFCSGCCHDPSRARDGSSLHNCRRSEHDLHGGHVGGLDRRIGCDRGGLGGCSRCSEGCPRLSAGGCWVEPAA